MNSIDTQVKTILIFAFIEGLVLYLIAGRMNYKKDKYEFENRTSGGVVESKDYKHYNRSKNSGKAFGCLGSIGFLLMAISGIIFEFIWFMSK
ncbi:hypothetical protein ACOCEA_04855 [Maribacter sp. CXY002]|uniref:hypothetical protein n=1 Tax=Maribacter luteocoastalis TaxID=3407671 RepID=UPI003B672B12